MVCSLCPFCCSVLIEWIFLGLLFWILLTAAFGDWLLVYALYCGSFDCVDGCCSVSCLGFDAL